MLLLTFDFVLGLFSPPLELFAVVVEPLQAHDAVLQAGAARTRDVTQPSGGLEGPDEGSTSLLALHVPTECFSTGLSQHRHNPRGRS